MATVDEAWRDALFFLRALVKDHELLTVGRMVGWSQDRRQARFRLMAEHARKAAAALDALARVG